MFHDELILMPLGDKSPAHRLSSRERTKYAQEKDHSQRSKRASHSSKPGFSSRDTDAILEVFDGLNSMQRCEELLGKLKAKTSGFMETRGGRDVLLTEDDFAELVQDFGVPMPRGRIHMLYSELQRLEGMKDGISVDMVAVAEACFAQKLFGVFQMYASQTLSSTRWLMKPAGFVRLLEDAGVAGKGRALSSAMARALACKATGQGRAGFDYKAFLINLARAASHLGVSFDDLVFEMRPLEHRLTQDNNFVRLIRHDAVQASWPIRSSLLRSVATTNELDISEEHEHMRRRRIATNMILETGGSFRTNTQEQWSELGALPKKVLQHRATLRTMAIAKDLGTMAERNRTTRQQAKLTIGSAPDSPQKGVPGEAIRALAKDLMEGRQNGVRVRRKKGSAGMSDIQTSVYGYVRRPALQVLLKDAPKADATSPTRVSMTGAKKAEEGAGGGLMGWGDLLKGAKAEKDEEGDRAQAAPAADTSAVMTEQGASSMLDMIREDGRRRNRLSKMKYVADMTFTVDRLWVEHKGSFDMMTKRSRGVRMLAEVFQEIATPRGDGQVVKCAAFSRLMRGAGWRTSDHVFSRFMAQEGQCTHEGMNFINFLRASEYMGQLHHVDDFNECGRLLLNSFRTARGLPGRPMSGRPPSGRQGKSKRAMTPGLHRGEAGQARHVHGSLSGGRTTPQ